MPGYFRQLAMVIDTVSQTSCEQKAEYRQHRFAVIKNPPSLLFGKLSALHLPLFIHTYCNQEIN